MNFILNFFLVKGLCTFLLCHHSVTEACHDVIFLHFQSNLQFSSELRTYEQRRQVSDCILWGSNQPLRWMRWICPGITDPLDLYILTVLQDTHTNTQLLTIEKINPPVSRESIMHRMIKSGNCNRLQIYLRNKYPAPAALMRHCENVSIYKARHSFQTHFHSLSLSLSPRLPNHPETQLLKQHYK